MDRPSLSIQPACDADLAEVFPEAADGLADTRRSTSMRLLNLWVSRFRHTLRAAGMAVDPGEDDDPGENDEARPPQSTPDPAARVVLAHDDLLWFKTRDRKSTRLNSSHANISYVVFCLTTNTVPPRS